MMLTPGNPAVRSSIAMIVIALLALAIAAGCSGRVKAPDTGSTPDSSATQSGAKPQVLLFTQPG